MSSPTVAEELKELVIDSGARLGRLGHTVNLLDIQRKKVSWFSKNIQLKIGVPPKPAAGSTCPLCQKSQQVFELDHMGPWRVYVAALAGPHVTHGPKGELFVGADIMKILYNDPANLWWICKPCNGEKSDQTYDTQAQLLAIQSGDVPKGQKGVDPSKMF